MPTPYAFEHKQKDILNLKSVKIKAAYENFIYFAGP